MKKRILHPLSNVSLTASHGLEGNSPPNSPLQPPMIILKFLYPQVPLVEKILIPYAKPEHVIAGYFRDTDEEMVLGCYILVHVAKPEDSEDHLYLIGTQVKISEMTMKIWQNQRMQFGKFIVASGLVSEEQPDEVLFTDPLWTCICTEFHSAHVISQILDRIRAYNS